MALPPLPDQEGLQCACVCVRAYVFWPDLASIPGCNLAVKRTFISDPPTCNCIFSTEMGQKFHVQTSIELELEELKYLNHVAFIGLAR